MNLINRDTDYAVRALCYMAKKPDGVVSVTELHPELDVPRPYLRRILQTLARHGVLRSYRGKGGGFVLDKLPTEIFLKEVIELFQGKIDLAKCMFRNKLCPSCGTCPLRRTVKDIEAMAIRKMRNVTIQSLL